MSQMSYPSPKLHPPAHLFALNRALSQAILPFLSRRLTTRLYPFTIFVARRSQLSIDICCSPAIGPVSIFVCISSSTSIVTEVIRSQSNLGSHLSVMSAIPWKSMCRSEQPWLLPQRATRRLPERKLDTIGGYILISILIRPVTKLQTFVFDPSQMPVIKLHDRCQWQAQRCLHAIERY